MTLDPAGGALAPTSLAEACLRASGAAQLVLDAPTGVGSARWRRRPRADHSHCGPGVEDAVQSHRTEHLAGQRATAAVADYQQIGAVGGVAQHLSGPPVAGVDADRQVAGNVATRREDFVDLLLCRLPGVLDELVGVR